MRSLLTVSCVVLIYVVGLMTATGTSLWTAAVSDQEAAAIFGGACITWYDNFTCSTASSTCRPLVCYGSSGTGNTIRKSDAYEPGYCAGGTNTSCSLNYNPLQGCLQEG